MFMCVATVVVLLMADSVLGKSVPAENLSSVKKKTNKLYIVVIEDI